MNIRIKLVDPSMPVPEYQTEGSVAFDLYAREDTMVEPWKPTLVPLNIIVQTPPGYFFMLAARSSLPKKKSLMVANSIGVVDQDYCGDEDEVMLQVINFSSNPVKVEKGERIAQGLLVKIEKAETLEVVTTMGADSRGGVGSTGGYK